MKFNVECVLVVAGIDLESQRDGKYGFVKNDGELWLPSGPLVVSSDAVIRQLATKHIAVDFNWLAIEKCGYLEDLERETIYLLFRTRFPYFIKTTGIEWLGIHSLKDKRIPKHFVNIIGQTMVI